MEHSLLLPQLINCLFQCLKALLTDYVLDPAGIMNRCFFLDSQYHQPGRDQLMTFIYLIGNLMSILCQTDISVVGYWRRFFMATLTLGFLKPISAAISTALTRELLFPRIRIVSK